jgi:hypothetical protein
VRKKHVAGILVLLVTTACQMPTRQFGSWKGFWPAASNQAPGVAATQPAAQASPQRSYSQSNYFNIRILESTGNPEALQNAWSYLDESSPVGKDWQMLHRNGLRCGIGQYSDWPTMKDQLEKCGTKVRGDVQVQLGGFVQTTLLADKFRSERTIFYYDHEGRVHGKDFGASGLEFTLTTAGRMPEGRIRIIFSPKIIKRGSREGLNSSRTEQELENFNVMVDLGGQEFALIGPSSSQMAGTLLGPQLFLQWENGERKSLFILVSPAVLAEKTEGKK